MMTSGQFCFTTLTDKKVKLCPGVPEEDQGGERQTSAETEEGTRSVLKPLIIIGHYKIQCEVISRQNESLFIECSKRNSL